MPLGPTTKTKVYSFNNFTYLMSVWKQGVERSAIRRISLRGNRPSRRHVLYAMDFLGFRGEPDHYLQRCQLCAPTDDRTDRLLRNTEMRRIHWQQLRCLPWVVQGWQGKLLLVFLMLKSASTVAGFPPYLGGQHDGVLLSGSPPIVHIHIHIYIFHGK